MEEPRTHAAQVLQSALLGCMSRLLSGIIVGRRHGYLECSPKLQREVYDPKRIITESQLNLSEASSQAFQPFKENVLKATWPSSETEAEGLASLASPKYRTSSEREKIAFELRRFENGNENKRDSSYETPHRQGKLRSPSCKLRRTDIRQHLGGSPLDKTQRMLSPSLKHSPYARDKIVYKKTEALMRTSPGVLNRALSIHDSFADTLSTPPRSTEPSKHSNTVAKLMKELEPEQMVMETEPAPRSLSKSRLYRNVGSRTDSGLRSSSVKRLIDTPKKARLSKSPQIRGLNTQQKIQGTSFRAVDMLTSETLERRKKFFQTTKLEEFLGQVSDVFRSNTAVEPIMSSKAGTFLRQLQKLKLDDNLTQFARDVCVEVSKTHGKFSTLSQTKLQQLFKVTPSAPVKLTPEEKEIQHSEEQLASAISKMTVRKLKELTSSKCNQAANVQAGLALLILFSEIDTSVEVSPGFKVLKSRSWQAVANYFAVPGRAANTARNIAEFIRKGQISPSVIKQTSDQSHQLRLSRDDNSAINVVHEYLCSVLSFYDVWVKYHASESYLEKLRAFQRSKTPMQRSKSSHGDAITACSTKSSKAEDASTLADSKENTRVEVVCESPLDWVADQEDLMQSFGGLRDSQKNMMTFHPNSINWVVKETSTQTENLDPNFQLVKSSSVINLEQRLLTEEVRAEEAKLKVFLENSFRTYLTDKVAVVSASRCAMEKDRRRLRLTIEMTAFDQRHAWLEEFMQDLDASESLGSYRHDVTQKVTNWLEQVSEDECFKSEVKSAYNQLCQRHLLTESN